MLLSKNYFFNRKYLCWISCIRRVRKIFCKLIFQEFSLQGFACKIWRESTEIMYEILQKFLFPLLNFSLHESLYQGGPRKGAIPVCFLLLGGIQTLLRPIPWTMAKSWLKSHLSEKSAFPQYSWTVAEKVHFPSWAGNFGRVIRGKSSPGIEYGNQVWNRIGHVPWNFYFKAGIDFSSLVIMFAWWKCVEVSMSPRINSTTELISHKESTPVESMPRILKCFKVQALITTEHAQFYSKQTEHMQWTSNKKAAQLPFQSTSAKE